MRYVALLCAVNAPIRLPMADLRAVLADLGYTHMATYLQTGNAVFTAADRDPTLVAAEIEDKITESLGISIRTLIRTADELRAVIENNPLEIRDPAKALVSFLETSPDPERLRSFDAAKYAPEEMRATHREIYYYLPNGIGRAKMPVALGRHLRLTATGRNWNTTTKLLELADG